MDPVHTCEDDSLVRAIEHHLDRNPERLVRRAGFEVEEAKQEYVEGMKTRLGE